MFKMSSTTDTTVNINPIKQENKQPTSTTSTRIVAWGSTTGKLYLDDARLDDPKSRGSIWERLFGSAGDKDDGGKVGDSAVGNNGRDGGGEQK
ncbi:hypothetical protein PV04_01731 [Phialophora macrospora]|uniref:Uncharacterized protein n=1 Tax=Phialophora macrospora TaxID=1851006 RepID=A0A0D2EGZ7_9EURO|nr:hypothetical protein PV04_01731 [Phialophora macrospora]